MSLEKNDLDFCVGTVTIIAGERQLLLTGVILEVIVEDEEEFVSFKLTAPLRCLDGSGFPGAIQPWYVVGDIIRLNVSQIKTIGPSHIQV